MNRLLLILAPSALFFAPFAQARDCPAPPVRNSEQAICHASAYGDKNGLPHGAAFTRRAAKGKSAWNVRFEDTRAESRGAGWEAEVDLATGTVTRFKSYKGDSS